MISFFDYKASLCECGQPFSESIWDQDNPAAHVYQGSFRLCLACHALERAEYAQAAKVDKTIKPDKQPFVPHTSRKWRVRKITAN